METIRSGFVRLNKSDIIKGFVMAFATPILVYLADIIGVPGFTFAALDIGMLVKIGLASGFTYLIKNWLTDSQGKLLGHWG